MAAAEARAGEAVEVGAVAGGGAQRCAEGDHRQAVAAAEGEQAAFGIA